MTATGITMFQDVAGTIAGALDHATPAQLAAPSPCTGWTRRDVLNHMIGASGMFAACARGESQPFPDWSVMPDWAGDACRHQFACFTVASPAAAWSALTSPRQTGAYLYGLAAHSSWQPDAPIQFQIVGQYPITGQVLHVQAPCRLSYVLQTGPGDPPLYLTWQIRPSPGGSTIWLQIDETEFADTDEEAENTWLPALAALQELVAASTRTNPATSTRKQAT